MASRQAHNLKTAGSSPAPPALSPLAGGLLSLLRIEASAEAPITQLAAGIRMGLAGADDTVRRKVQHFRDEINDSGRAFIVSSWGTPPGMWVAESDKEIDDYLGTVLGRAYTTIGQFRGLDRVRRRRIAEQVQGVLGLDDEEIGPQEPRLRVAEGSSRCPQCAQWFEPGRSDQVYCSPDCRYMAARERGSI